MVFENNRVLDFSFDSMAAFNQGFLLDREIFGVIFETSSVFCEEEFFIDIKDGYRLAKVPDGFLGKGIHPFSDVEEIKKNILKLKNTNN